MRDQPRSVLDWRSVAEPVVWCCSYCAAPLERRPFGLFCAAEGRFFATERGVHRLLPEERRRELLPFLELYQRVRRDEGWLAEPGLPDVPPTHPKHSLWRARASRFRRALQLASAALGPGPWRVLDLGAGNCWISARLLELGHNVTAVDLSLDPLDGLLAAERLLRPGMHLERAEAEMEALPIDAGAFDLVVAGASLHYAEHLVRTLVELRRVTRRGGLLIVLDSPVFRRRPDGEAMVADRMRKQAQQYGVVIPRESQSGYLVMGELADVFSSSGFRLETHGWPGLARELLRDMFEIAHWGRRTARFPILVARREG
jgi:SAM-dependent methyltransferase